MENFMKTLIIGFNTETGNIELEDNLIEDLNFKDLAWEKNINKDMIFDALLASILSDTFISTNKVNHLNDYILLVSTTPFSKRIPIDLILDNMDIYKFLDDKVFKKILKKTKKLLDREDSGSKVVVNKIARIAIISELVKNPNLEKIWKRIKPKVEILVESIQKENSEVKIYQ
jgi:hypothetical protein